MLGLEEEQVVEISGDHSKYEVLDFLKLINLSHPPHIRFLTPYTGPFSHHNRYLSFIEYLCRLFLSLRQTSWHDLEICPSYRESNKKNKEARAGTNSRYPF